MLEIPVFDSAETYRDEDWSSVVARIQTGDQRSAEHLYQSLAVSAGRRLGRTADASMREDGFHDVVVSVLEAIQGGRLRELGFVRTVTERRVAKHIRGKITERKHLVQMGWMEVEAPTDQSPDAPTNRRERTESLHRALLCLRPRDREILVRYYCEEQSPEQVCREMGLTATQFRLFKSRALARCGEVFRRRLYAAGG